MQKKKSLFFTLGIMVAFMILGAMPVKASADKAVKITKVSSVDDFQRKIDAGLAFSSQEQIGAARIGEVFKVVVPKDGFLLLKDYSDGFTSLQRVSLYSNFALTNEIASVEGNTQLAKYVEKGTYYYRSRNNAGSCGCTNTVYAGYIPSSNIVSVKSIKLNPDKASAVVTFRPTVSYETIRTIKGNVYYPDIFTNTKWAVDNQLNCAHNKRFTVTANGTYSSRIFTKDTVTSAFIIKYKVSGINNKKPSTPKIKKCKAGVKAISGTAAAYTKVYVKVGAKTYKGSVDSKGRYTVKTSAVKKGSIVKVFVKNSAGKASSVSTLKIK